MKTILIYAGLFGLLLYWIMRNRRHPNNEVQAEMEEQRRLQRLGQQRTNAEIWSTPALWDSIFWRTNSEIFTPQTPINTHETAIDGSIYGQAVLPRRFGTSTIQNV